MEEEKPLFDNLAGLPELGNLNGRFRREWVEESLISEASEDSSGLSRQPTRSYLGNSISEKKVKYFWVTITLVTVAILAKIIYLQLIQGDDLFFLAEGNRIRLRPIIAERGIISDRFGVQLVENVPSFSLNIVPQDLPKDPEKRNYIVATLAEAAKMAPSEIEEIMYKYRNYRFESIVVKEDLEYETALRLYIESANLPGVIIESGTKRYYPQTNPASAVKAESLSHILGYVGKINEDELAKLKDTDNYVISDTIGKSGIEKKYESLLRGDFGKKKIEVDATGKQRNVIAEEAPIPGNNLSLTIDLEAQVALETAMKKVQAVTNKTKMAAVAMNPNTGAILAMASLPAYDNNLFSGGISRTNYQSLSTNPDRPLFNRVIGGSYPSGSIIKPVIVAAALAEGVATPATTVLSTGGFTVGRWTFKDWKAGGHGVTNAVKAIAWSVNTYLYYIGGGYGNFTGLGPDRIAKYLALFGLGKPTGLDLIGENSGFIPTKEWKKQTKGEQWYDGDTYNLSIGQGDLLVTPIQAAVWTAAVSNGGYLVTPYLANYYSDPQTQVTTTIERKKVVGPIIKNNVLKTVQEGMRECVLSGSCKLLQTLPFAASGKTGTAQWSKTKATHAWFTAYAPSDNPQIVIAVLTEEGGEGAVVSMPIARDFLAWWGKKYLRP